MTDGSSRGGKTENGSASALRRALARKPSEPEQTFVLGLARHDGVTVEELWKAYLKEKDGRRVVRSMNFEWVFLNPTSGHLEPKHITIDLCREYTKKRRVTGKRGATADGTIWTGTRPSAHGAGLGGR